MNRVKYRRSRRINGVKFINFKNPNLQLCLLALLIIAGVAAGSLIFRGSGAKSSGFGSFLQDAFTSTTKTKNFFALFFSSFLSSSLLIAGLFVCGLCAAGLPGLLFIPFFRGAGLGYTISYIYFQYGVKGVAFTALCIIPEAVLTSLAIVVSSREGIAFSVKICSILLPFHSNPKQEMWKYFQEYCRKNAGCFLFIAAAAFLESLTSLWLSGYLIP